MPPALRPPGVPPTRKGFATRWRGGTDTHNKGRSRAAPGRRPRYYTGAAAKARTGAPSRRALASQEGRGGAPGGLAPPTRDSARTRGLGGGGKSSSRVRALHFRSPAPPRPAPIASHKLSNGCVFGSFTTKFVLLECVRILLGDVTGPRANGRAGQHGMEQLHMDTPRRQPCV
ncbi:hypothetical protein R6Z07F_010445 [Ovis aries]